VSSSGGSAAGRRRVGAGTLQALPRIGETTTRVIAEAVRGEEPAYLSRLPAEQAASERSGLRAALRGDRHTHSD
jgi:putative hydrolase